MLLELMAKNFALFHRVEVHFRPGFTAITGETGSGKSLLVNSLSLLLGRKADTLWIREGEEEAWVEGVFSLKGLPHVKACLREGGIPVEEELLVRRTISREGRNRAYVNDTPVTLRFLQEIATGLVEIQGQRESLLLLKAQNHLRLLDAFGRLDPLVKEYREAFRTYKRLLQEKEEADRSREERLRRMDYLAFQIEDIEKTAPKPGEDEELRQRREWLRQGERLKEALAKSTELLDGEGPSVAQGLREVLGLLSPLAPLKKDLEREVAHLEEALIMVQEGCTNLEGLLEKVEINPLELAEVEERLDILHRLKTRYGNTLERVLEYLEEAKKEYTALKATQERSEGLEEDIHRAQEKVLEVGRRLGEARREAAQKMEKRVEETLEQLLMEECRFIVHFRDLPEPEAHGLERVEFFIRPNPGEAPKPLNKVASGGELSRMSLAIRRVLSDIGEIPILILDEIDAGIGGITAHKVGELLKELGERYQVICITHLPQVARHAHWQLAVHKERDRDRTVTRIRELSPSEREEELKRMVGEKTPQEVKG